MKVYILYNKVDNKILGVYEIEKEAKGEIKDSDSLSIIESYLYSKKFKELEEKYDNLLKLYISLLSEYSTDYYKIVMVLLILIVFIVLLITRMSV